MLVLWSTPKDNGSSIRRFILQGKGAGDDVFFELYVGLSTAHYVTDLIPEFAYTFIVSAENDIVRNIFINITPSNFHELSP